ncbi:MAG TPA: DUF1634 domain-containing protein [Candidatus Limnocylindrales bacterium]
MTQAGVGEPVDTAGVRLERSIARLLTIGTYLSIALLAIGFVLMLATGVSPLAGTPAFDPASIPADLLALRPLGYLWLGLIVIVATPSARVVASLIGYARSGERRMVYVSIAILVVIGLSVTLATGLEG